MRTWMIAGVSLAVLGLAVAVRAADPGPLQDLRARVFDAYQQLAPRPYDDELPVVVVDIDDASLKRFGQWPWPRTLLARLLDRLRQAGAATVALDIVFAEPDRTSPEALVRTWPDTPEWRELKALAARKDLPDHDRVFAAAAGRMRTVVGFVLTGGAADGAAPPKKFGLALAGDDPRRFVHRYPGAVVNLPPIAAAAMGAGSLNVAPDGDGVVRRVPLIVARGDELYPSLAAEALRVAQGASTYFVKASGAEAGTVLSGATGVSKVKIGRIVAHTDGRGQVVLRDSGPQARRRIPAWRVLAGEADPARLAGAIVFVGTSAAGLVDLRTTPLAAAAPGVELHAQIAEQILTQDFLHRPDWATGAEIVFIVVLGAAVIGCFAVLRTHGATAATLALALIAGGVWGSWHAFRTWDFLLDPAYPAGAGLAVYLTTAILSFLQSEGERRRIRAAFSHYMAPTMVERLASEPGGLKLGGENRELTLLFADIRGFTGISERYDAEGLTRFMNRYLTPMTDAILECGGTIDKYMGDAIMAFWNAPLDDPDHAANACRAALEMRRRLAVLNAELAAEAAAGAGPDVRVRVGVGLNTGMCCVGNLGSERRFDYSALGDEVNLASRLEGRTKVYGVETVVGEHTHEQAAGFALVELDLVRVRGKTQPARIYALLGGPELAAREDFADLQARQEALLASFRQQRWAEARAALAACRAHPLAGPLELLYDIYAERIERLQAQPPGADWDGVHLAARK